MIHLRIYQNKKLIDETDLRHPPMVGAYLYAGRPGRELIVKEVERDVIADELTYNIYCVLKPSKMPRYQ